MFNNLSAMSSAAAHTGDRPAVPAKRQQHAGLRCAIGTARGQVPRAAESAHGPDLCEISGNEEVEPMDRRLI